jgi:PadR family transcriptional regulator AphA
MDIKTLCLAVLIDGDNNGYQIRETINRVFGHFQGASSGALYPALGQLLAKEQVICIDGQRNPLEKKTYQITDKGRQAFSVALRKAGADEKTRSDFLAAMFFSDELEIDEVRGLIDQRLAGLRVEQKQLRDIPLDRMTEAQRFTIRYSLALQAAAIDFITGEGRAIVAVIEREKRN